MTDNQRTEADEQILKALFADDFKGMEDAIKNGASLNTPYNEHGTTPFMWICREHTDPSVYEWALKMGASVHQTDDCGHTPLHILARKRCAFFPCLDILIQAGADVNAVDIKGNTPLMALLLHPQVKLRMGVVHGLYEAGSDCSIKNVDGQTAYDIANNNPSFNDNELLLHFFCDAFGEEPMTADDVWVNECSPS